MKIYWINEEEIKEIEKIRCELCNKSYPEKENHTLKLWRIAYKNRSLKNLIKDILK